MSLFQIVRLKQVLSQLAIGKTNLYTKISEGLFPIGIQLSKQSVGWLSSEVDIMIKAIVSGKSNDETKAIVRDIITARGDI